MNYLELCQEVRELTGGQKSDITALTGNSRDLTRIISWVKQAWVEIQEYREDWEWMRKPFTFDTVSHQGEYTPAEANATTFGRWKQNSFRLYLTSAGVGNEMILNHEESYTDFRDYWLLGARKLTYSRPITIAIAPNKNLLLGMSPNDVYTVSGEYFIAPQFFSAATDIPPMPDRFHMLIVHKACIKYGVFEAAGEVIQEHTELYRAMLNKLEADQAPTIFTGASLI